jgi:prepilin-type N-terminal cleavage/methylation domain-containing protein
MQRDNRSNRGFTLLELMIVAAIIGILAAVAIPSYLSYIRESKASEVMNIMQGIREREESFFAEFKRFTPQLDWAPYDGSLVSDPTICGKTHIWANLPVGWGDLGFHPDAPTYYTYQVETAYDAAGALANAVPNDTPGHPATMAAGRPWYRITATGDIDCNGVPAFFFVTSYNKTIVKAKGYGTTQDLIDSTVY